MMMGNADTPKIGLDARCPLRNLTVGEAKARLNLKDLRLLEVNKKASAMSNCSE